ncbi:FtsX-like permease family protein [Actinoplanes awajinensis]|uniref:Permease n=1 Tax=Actinoplanes awajinensis subsp. mycoplanecinus TaxID=135947 RepID=A0A101JKV0_9ACTN|nr:FtsX-like permease family protein [Actinoplanes awajinensis]KUL28593.1 permease [Actinoplanes awajinensis subsp. mycoplanecinus]
MIALLGRRARAQWPVLAALLAVVTLGATLLGVCALLVTRSASLALGVAAAQAEPDRTTVTAYTANIDGKDAAAVTDATRAVLTSAITPFGATTAARASSVTRELPGRTDDARTYLSSVEDLPEKAALVTGRWPRAAGHPARAETVLLESTAKLLGLRVGSRVRLAAKPPDSPAPAVLLTVVGIARPLPGAGWDRDPLDGAGYEADHNDGDSTLTFPAYGPFLVALPDLLDGGSSLSRMEIAAYPDLSHATPATLNTLVVNVLDADPRLTGTVGERAQFTRIASGLTGTLIAARHQQDVTEAAVLAVAVLGTVLTAAALALAGRLTAGLRAGETALLSALGTSRAQLAATAVLEAGLIALAAVALGVPLSSLLHAGLSHLAPMSGAGLATAPQVSGGQVLAVAAGALALTVILTLMAIRSEAAPGERGRRELLARSGADLLLVVFAGLGWWQLHARSAAPDTLQTLAPALLLTAGAALALRLVPPALRVADRLARRADGLPLPLAAFEAARRPQAAAAGLLICLAAATGTFGIALDATWNRSQHDQADLAVGTDLTVTLATPPTPGQGGAIAAATGAGVVSPASKQGLAIGQWLGAGDPPQLVTTDTTHAAQLLRGRLPDGDDWAGVTRGLAPAAPAGGSPVPVGGTFVLAGTATGSVPLTVAPKLLLQDPSGLRTLCTAAPITLDGTRHRIAGCAPADGMRLIAVALPVEYDPYALVAPGQSKIAVTLVAPGPVGDIAGWTTLSAEPMAGQIAFPAARAAGNRLRLTGTVQVGASEGGALTLVTMAFPAPEVVPAVVSRRLADGLGVHVGSPLEVAVGTTAVPIKIAGIVPDVPAAPGAAAVLVDLDTLSRVLTAHGDLEYPVDSWWVGEPTRTDLDDLHLGTVLTRAGETARLTAGPLNAGLPAVLLLLVPAAVLLLLAGVLLHVTHDLRDRAGEVARLRGIGMTGREIRTTLLAQHAFVLFPLLAAGALVGALGTLTVAPLLVRAETGAPPIPAVTPAWPWGAELLLLALLVAGCTLAVGVVAGVQARRAGAAQIRVVS